MKKKILYSVIIPTYNRCESLKEALLSVATQTVDKSLYEILIVDDGSTDGTRKTVDEFRKKKFLNTFYINQKNQGCASARNTGIKNANGDILFFTDDDCIVPSDWIARILEGFKKYPSVVGVGGWYSHTREELSKNVYAEMFNISERLNYSNYENYSVLGNTGINPCGNTANVAYRKKVFNEVGLFDTYTKRTAMVDYELKLRIICAGLYTLYLPIIVTHKKKVTLKEYIHKAFRYGIADYYLSKRYPKIHHTTNLINIFNSFYEMKNQNSKSSLLLLFVFLMIRSVGGKYAQVRKIEPKFFFVKKKIYRSIEKTFTNKIKQVHELYTAEDYFYNITYLEKRKEIHDLLARKHEKPIISIVIPFYNREDFITENFINSLNDLEGESSSSEIIFVNDGSTDNTLKKLEEIMPKLRFRTTVLSKTNGGPSSARNLGIINAKGNYVFFTDSDVIVPRLWFSWLLLPFFMDKRVAVSGGSQINENPKNYFDIWRNSTIKKSFYEINNIYNLRPYDTANMCVDVSKLKSKECLYFDTLFIAPGCEDLDYVINIKKAGFYSAYVPFSVLNMRSLNIKSFVNMAIIRSQAMLILKEKHKDIEQVLPRFFYKENIHSLIDTFIKFITRKKQQVFLLHKIYNHCVNGEKNNITYRSLKKFSDIL